MKCGPFEELRIKCPGPLYLNKETDTGLCQKSVYTEQGGMGMHFSNLQDLAQRVGLKKEIKK
jgi:hypothetical protein